jgi:glycerol-3-phosphate dehydrogenase
VVEGIPTLEFVYLKAKEANLNIPITIALYNIIHGHIKYEDALKDLMTQ